jgi:hypothetical protein
MAVIGAIYYFSPFPAHTCRWYMWSPPAALADEQTHAPITATVPNGHIVANRAAFDTGIMGFSADEADTFCTGSRMLSQ